MKTNRINVPCSTSKSIAGYSSSKSLKSKDTRRSQNRNELPKKKLFCNTFPDPNLKLFKSQFMLDDSADPGPSEEPAPDEAPPPPPKPSWRQRTKDTINKGVDKIFDMLDDGKAKCDGVINETKTKIVETGRKILDSIEKS